MLKISIIDTPRQRKLVGVGKLIGPWSAELKTVCESMRHNLEGRELVVDVQNLTAISQEGENVLCDLLKEGVKLHGCGVFAKEVLRHLSRRARVQVRRQDCE